MPQPLNFVDTFFLLFFCHTSHGYNIIYGIFFTTASAWANIDNDIVSMHERERLRETFVFVFFFSFRSRERLVLKQSKRRDTETNIVIIMAIGLKAMYRCLYLLWTIPRVKMLFAGQKHRQKKPTGDLLINLSLKPHVAKFWNFWETNLVWVLTLRSNILRVFTIHL